MRRPQDIEWNVTLIVPVGIGEDRGGFMTLRIGPKQWTVPLIASHVRLLVELHRAATEDSRQGIDAAACGWRSPSMLSQQIADGGEWRIPVEAQTIRAYFSRIQRSIRETVSRADGISEIPKLFEHRRQVGIRLVPSRWNVVDGSIGREVAACQYCA